MKIITAIILSFFCISVFAQGVLPFLGANISQFYFNENKNGDVTALFTPVLGTSMGIFVDQSKTKAKIPSFSIQYDEFDGSIFVQSGGDLADVYYEKSSLAIAVYFINKSFWKNFNYHSGGEISLLLSERFEGRRRNESGGIDAVSELNDVLSNPVSFFLKNQISYDFNMSKRMNFRLYYAFLFGLNSEFDIEPDIIKTIRHYGGVGFSYDLNLIE